MMTQAEAKEYILAEWEALPEAKRPSGVDMVGFALEMKEKYPFRCSGDPYQRIKGWINSRRR